MIDWFDGKEQFKVDDKAYKEPKEVSGQIAYLERNKNVIFQELDKSQASDLLLRRNYINTVTPFKHEFARRKGNHRFECERDNNGSHIYDDQTDFAFYSLAYEEERNEYEYYYDGISKFETAFKSIVGNNFLTKYNVKTLKRAYESIDVLINRVEGLKLKSAQGEESVIVRKNQMKRSLYRFRNRLLKREYKDKTVDGQDIYILFDRAGLPDILNVFLTLKGKQQVEIFKQMQDWNLNLNAKNHKEFAEKVFNLGSIRNCVMHFNSLTILLKYTDDSKKQIRGVASSDRYEEILKSLKYISKNCIL